MSKNVHFKGQNVYILILGHMFHYNIPTNGLCNPHINTTLLKLIQDQSHYLLLHYDILATSERHVGRQVDLAEG